MNLARGRVLKASPKTVVAPSIERTTAALPQAEIVRREVYQARIEARRHLEQAAVKAEQLIREAEKAAQGIREGAEIEGRNTGAATFAAGCIRLAEIEARADERALSRSIELATVLAERLLGEALALDPARVVALAKEALEEARGARSIRVHAHPEDRLVLASDAAQLGLTALAFHEATDLSRGELRIETELGTLHALPKAEILRLATRLAESLRGSRRP